MHDVKACARCIVVQTSDIYLIASRGDEVIATRRKHIRQVIDFILLNYDA